MAIVAQSAAAAAPLLWLLVASAHVWGSLAWDYTKNGLNWNDLGMCAGNTEETSAQSPIDLPESAAPNDAEKVWFRYPQLGRTVQLYNNGNSIAMTLPEAYRGGFGIGAGFDDLVHEGSEVYRLWQINFHSPSEHTINGKHFPLEMQMMHQRVTGSAQTAVVVVLFEEADGMFNDFLEIVSGGGLPRQPWDEVAINTASTRREDLPPGPRDIGFQRVVSGGRYFQYTGSLTVPPCESQVKYFVRKTTVKAAPNQLLRFRNVLRELCPPEGNWRRPPAASTAQWDLQLISAEDGFTREPASIPPRASEGDLEAAMMKEASKPKYQAMVRDDPTFKLALPTDSHELRRVKMGYQQAVQSYELARNSDSAAERNLASMTELYDNAPGIVNKIDLKWKVIQAQKDQDAAKLLVTHSEREMSRAAFRAIVVIVTEEEARKRQERTATPGTTGRPREAGSGGAVITTVSPYVEEEALQTTTAPPAEPWDTLQYMPRVKLPRGLQASPFIARGPTGGVAFGGDSAIDSDAERIAVNLRQAEGGPVPEVVGITTTVAPVLVNQTMQLVFEMPIALANVSNVTGLGLLLRDSIAESLGVPAENVDVAEFRSVGFTPIVAATPPQGSTFLLQRSASYTSAERQKRGLHR